MICTAFWILVAAIVAADFLLLLCLLKTDKGTVQ